MASQERNRDHVVIFPFMAKGHTIPLLHLSTALANRGLKVTFLTTPGNSPFVRRSLLPNPNIHILHLPFPRVPSLPDGCESTDHLTSPHLYPTFLFATKLLRHPFHQTLHRMSSGGLPLCVVSDFFLGWTLPVCRQFGVPRLVFHGMGVFGMTLCKSLFVNQTHLSAAASGEEGGFHVPGTPDALRLMEADVPDMIREADPSDPMIRFLAEAGESDVDSWGVLVNSFAELERDYVAPFETFYRSNGARAWLVGPLSLYPRRRPIGESDESPVRDTCVEWLDGKPPGSVVYVSFGTQTHVSGAQLDEVAHGLEMSGCEFVWVVRSGTWTPPEGTCRRGLIVHGWAPQEEVLEHASTGGFVSHCGWNSVLESVSAGVPILVWPMMAEQPLNAKYVMEELGAGLRVAPPSGEENGGFVERREICEGVMELMGEGEKGGRVRKRAEELGKVAREAVAEAGSSYQCLSKLIEELRRS